MSTCYDTHSLVARTLALPAPPSIAQDAPRSTSADELEVYSTASTAPQSNPQQMSNNEINVFHLEVSANQPCPFSKDNAKEWTREQQSICQQNIKDRRATTVEELRELVSVLNKFEA